MTRAVRNDPRRGITMGSRDRTATDYEAHSQAETAAGVSDDHTRES